MASSYTLGAYRAGEGAFLLFDRLYKGDGTKTGCLYAHGSVAVNHGADQALDPTMGIAAKIAALTPVMPVGSFDYGDPTVLAGTTSGPRHWGNDNAITSMGSAKAFLQNPAANGSFAAGHGASTSKFVIFGLSMAALLALNYLISLANPSAVCSGMVLGIPALNLDNIYQNNLGGFQASIGSAHNVTFPTAIPNLATHSPAAYSGANLAKLASIPIGLWAASDDPLGSNTAACSAWAATVGSNVVVTDLGAVGHDATTLTGAAVLAFLGAHL